MNIVDTLRVSVTDRCNLRCIYCMPPEGIAIKHCSDILRFEDIERISRVAVGEGVKKIRLTGGEPLTRRNVEALVSMLARIDNLEDLAMTTNGVLLGEKASVIKDAGLKRVTVSLDTLKSERYKSITRGSDLSLALAGIETARKHGLEPLKINVVTMRDINDDEAVDFAKWAVRENLEVRFIELMPISAIDGVLCSSRSGDAMVPSAETKAAIEREFGTLEPAPTNPHAPARLFALPGGKGKVGFISAVTEPFCRGCSRMRLTADGKLRGCLFSAVETDVMGPIKRGASDEEILALYRKAVELKPKRTSPNFSDNKRWMAQIGG